ncbi:MAG: CHAT domain-containing protein [Cyanobacteria bacterium P01_D01_bin.156]
MAEPLYQRALQIREAVLGESHPDVANSLNNLAFLYQNQGNYSAAESLHQRALQIRETALGENYPDVANSLNNLAELYRVQDDSDTAESLHQRALQIRETTLGENHPDVAASLNNLALLYQNQGDYEAAESLYQRSFKIVETILGENHPDVAVSLNNLASLYQDQTDYGVAEPLYQRALQIRETTLGENHPDIAASLNNLALLSWIAGDLTQANTLFNQSIDIEETNLALNLAIVSEARKRAYLVNLQSTTYKILSFHLQAATGNPDVAQLALTSLLQRKGRTLDIATNELQRLRQNLMSQDQTLLDELTTTRTQLATLIYGGLSDRTPETYRTLIGDLRNQVEQLENQLAQRSTEFRQEAQSVTVEAVQAQIPLEAALIEFVRYKPFDPKASPRSEQWDTPRYAAYVLFDQGEPKWVDLGEAAAIDQLVTDFRRDLATHRQSIQSSVRELDAALMQPIRALIGGQKHLLISPDSELNLIPFAALVDETDRYLVETYQITYLTSGRDLLKLQLDVSNQQGPVLFADPDYDNPGSPDTLSIATNFSLSSLGEETKEKAGQRSVDLNSLQFGPLPGTAEEISAIAPLLPNASILTGSQATENMLKQVQSPNILHIATHGFFLGDVPLVAPPADPNRATILVETLALLATPATPSNLENPLLRSGLALAGFNPRQSGDEDGVLTALEASGLNLYGTKLVVLSACETGLGDVDNGEGVYGLRRAFTLAGAESQLMSLWQVSDYGTSEFMQRYYQKLKDSMGRSEAMRQVQQEMMVDAAYSHPYYWAAFILSGDWTPIEGL